MRTRFQLIATLLIVLCSFAQLQAADDFLQLLDTSASEGTNNQAGPQYVQNLSSKYSEGLQSTWLMCVPQVSQAEPVITSCGFIGSDTVKPFGPNSDAFRTASRLSDSCRFYFFGVTQWGTIHGYQAQKVDEDSFAVSSKTPATPGNFDLMKETESSSFYLMVIPGFGAERVTPPIELAERIAVDETVTVRTVENDLAPIFWKRMVPYWQAYVFVIAEDGDISVVPTYIKEETKSGIIFEAPKPLDFH